MAAPTIQAIETEYAGCRFRSRLEARWAVFFDRLGIQWKYEPEGLDIDGVRYLPDFYLPEVQGLYVEVKGVMDVRSMEKVLTLADQRCAVLILGDIPLPESAGPQHFLYGRRSSELQCWRVQFAAVGNDLHWTLLPFGWPTPVDRTDPWDMADEADRCNAPDRIEGWTLPARDVAAAYRAARSARFEFGERG